jgi:CTP:molybdopterin cytidylyltransferase MocA
MNKDKIVVVVQTGGRSSRVKQNKALLDLFGKTIIERTFDRISIFGHVRL